MKALVAGLGVQGYKRREHVGKDYVASVDPANMEAEYRNIQDVPLDNYDAVLACIPDAPKIELLHYCLSNKKHVLVEKPLWAENDQQIMDLANLARQNQVVCYTAYNHRFEPHFMRMKELISSRTLGKIYSCRLFMEMGQQS